MKKTTSMSRLTALLTATAMLLCSAGLSVHADGPGGTPPDGEAPGGAPGGAPGSSSAPTSWDADLIYTSSDNNSEDTAYTPSVDSSSADYSAILNNGGTIWMQDVTASRSGSSSTGGDDASFYGIGATVLTVDGTSYIDGGTINSTDKGGAGIFSYNTGVTYVRNATINTTANTAGGIHAAGGGTLYAYNVNATSAGQSSAALRSDRGGGTMVVEGGSYTSNGTRSPAVYCTADITIADSVLTATKSEGICIEGLNSLAMWDCTLSGDAPVEAENNNLTWGIILYQSMSGDSSVGNSEFYMDGGSIDCTANGDTSALFFNTNTESTITLNDVDINTTDNDFDYILLVSGFSRWGSTGSNGADCIFTCIDQEFSGNVGWDSISELDLYLTDGSVLTGAVVNDNTFGQTSSGSGYCSIYVDADSDWVCTGDSTVTNLYNAGGEIVDASGKTVTIVSGGQTVVSGDSDYTITVTGTYETTAETSGATLASAYSYTPYASWNPWSDGDAEPVSTTDPTEETASTETQETTATETTPATEASSEPTEPSTMDTPPAPPETTTATDEDGNVITETRPTPPDFPGQETTTATDEDGNVVTETRPTPPDFPGQETTTATDEEGSTVTETQQTPPPKPGEETGTATETTPETAPSQPIPETTDYGDVNGDGAVDIMDVIALNKYLLGSSSLDAAAKNRADVDCNTEINSTDSLNILKYVVELIDSLPVSE